MKKKLKLSMTLNDYHIKLLEAASRVALPQAGFLESQLIRHDDFRRLISLALVTFLRAVIKRGGKVDMPMMAELRDEIPVETQMRIKGIVPKGGSIALPLKWSRWN